MNPIRRDHRSLFEDDCSTVESAESVEFETDRGPWILWAGIAVLIAVGILTVWLVMGDFGTAARAAELESHSNARIETVSLALLATIVLAILGIFWRVLLRSFLLLLLGVAIIVGIALVIRSDPSFFKDVVDWVGDIVRDLPSQLDKWHLPNKP